MDPNATWQRLIDALEEGDSGEAAEAAQILAEWIGNHGFVPKGLAVAIVLQRDENTRASLTWPPYSGIHLSKLQQALRY